MCRPCYNRRTRRPYVRPCAKPEDDPFPAALEHVEGETKMPYALWTVEHHKRLTAVLFEMARKRGVIVLRREKRGGNNRRVA
jgi:hypothetical protein